MSPGKRRHEPTSPSFHSRRKDGWDFMAAAHSRLRCGLRPTARARVFFRRSPAHTGEPIRGPICHDFSAWETDGIYVKATSNYLNHPSLSFRQWLGQRRPLWLAERARQKTPVMPLRANRKVRYACDKRSTEPVTPSSEHPVSSRTPGAFQTTSSETSSHTCPRSRLPHSRLLVLNIPDPAITPPKGEL